MLITLMTMMVMIMTMLIQLLLLDDDDDVQSIDLLLKNSLNETDILCRPGNNMSKPLLSNVCMSCATL